ncbi:hypothetical protein [uncultured Paracoccus sp.]|uniref:hypothetical protein n=1 Tax=uncultured Paracoccus sp. TaxID=189685 RepID=UPI00262D4B37|nr:hypothetical protein [uncultured Paracoccus sp.]
MIVSLLALVIVSLMTEHSPGECPRAVYWDDLPTAETRGAPGEPEGAVMAAQ